MKTEVDQCDQSEDDILTKVKDDSNFLSILPFPKYRSKIYSNPLDLKTKKLEICKFTPDDSFLEGNVSKKNKKMKVYSYDKENLSSDCNSSSNKMFQEESSNELFRDLRVFCGLEDMKKNLDLKKNKTVKKKTKKKVKKNNDQGSEDSQPKKKSKKEKTSQRNTPEEVLSVDDGSHLQKLPEHNQPYALQQEIKQSPEKITTKKVAKISTYSQEQELITKASMHALSEVNNKINQSYPQPPQEKLRPPHPGYTVPPAYSPPKNIKVDYDPRLVEIAGYPNPRQNIPTSAMHPAHNGYHPIDNEEAMRLRMQQERLAAQPPFHKVPGIFREDLKMGPYGEKPVLHHPPMNMGPGNIHNEACMNNKNSHPLNYNLTNEQPHMKQITRPYPSNIPPTYEGEMLRMHRLNQEPYEMRVNRNYQREIQNENNQSLGHELRTPKMNSYNHGQLKMHANQQGPHYNPQMRQLPEEEFEYDEQDLEIQHCLRYYKGLNEEQEGFINEHELRSRAANNLVHERQQYHNQPVNYPPYKKQPYPHPSLSPSNIYPHPTYKIPTMHPNSQQPPAIKIPGSMRPPSPPHMDREYIMELQRRRIIAKQMHIQHLKELAENKMLSEEAYIKQAILKNRMHDAHSPLHHQKHFYEHGHENYPMPPTNNSPPKMIRVPVTHQRPPHGVDIITPGSNPGPIYGPCMADRYMASGNTYGGIHPQFKNSSGPMKNPKEYSYRY